MTAKEYKTELIRLIHEAIAENKQEAYDKLAPAWDNYEQQLCREQREICAETSQLDPTCGRYEEIINAPMPEI